MMKLFRDRFASNGYFFIPHSSFILQCEPRYPPSLRYGAASLGSYGWLGHARPRFFKTRTVERDLFSV